MQIGYKRKRKCNCFRNKLYLGGKFALDARVMGEDKVQKGVSLEDKGGCTPSITLFFLFFKRSVNFLNCTFFC